MGMVSAAALAVAVFTVPGLIVAWLSGARGQWAIAASVPATFGIYGLAGWLFGLTDIRFGVTTVAWFTAGIALLAIIWNAAFFALRRRKRRRSESLAEPVEDGEDVGVAKPVEKRWRDSTLLDPSWLIPGAGMAAGIAYLMTRSLDLLRRASQGINNIFQGWDVHWHASVVRLAMDEGLVSSTRMGELQNTETQAKMYYPTAWHAGAALLGDLGNMSPIAATNLTGLIVPAIAFPISAGLIAYRLIGKQGLTGQLAAALAPMIVGGLPVLYWIGLYVGAWPYVAAIAVSGIVLALFMSIPHEPIRCFLAALAFIGMVQLHPSSATVVVIALALWWLLYLLWVPSRKPESIKGHFGWRLRDVGILGATGLVGVLALLPQILSGAEQSEEVKSFTATEDLSLNEAIQNAIFMRTRHTESFHLNVETWVWIAAAGAILLLLWRRNLWAPLFWAFNVAVTANALHPMSEPWGKWYETVGALHYNTAHRLVMPAAMFVAAGAAVAIAILIRLLTGGPLKKYVAVTSSLAVVATAGAGYVIHNQVRDGLERGSAWAINSGRDGRLVNERDLKAFDWLAKQPKAYEGNVFSNPDEGSGWMYAYNQLPALYKHYLWPTTTVESDTNSLFFHPMRLGQGNFDNADEVNRVDEAARNLGVKYIYISPPNFWAFQWIRPDFETGLITTPGVTPVYKDHQVIIYAVNAEFTDEEIMKMREPGNSPEELPPLRTKAEVAATMNPEMNSKLVEQIMDGTISYEESQQPYIHRPSVPNRGRDSHFEWLVERDKIKEMGEEGVKTGDSLAAEQQEGQRQ
ncbi:DUF6541 family protein [Corynebacterium sp. H130]|uniref:DUF6541 family protein n=1 Tax=Corynebacterium sp. H130 TaxID=3133444 RepID=UPI0030B4CBF8